MYLLTVLPETFLFQLQNNHLDKINEPSYLVSLKTQVSDRFQNLMIFPIFSAVVCPKIIVPRLYGYCGGAVDSTSSIFTHLHSIGQACFETLYESIWQVVANLWQRKAK